MKIRGWFFDSEKKGRRLAVFKEKNAGPAKVGNK
jgi:hypothetical protein